MKTLLVGEYRDGALLESTYELVEFSRQVGGESALFLVGDEAQAPRYSGKVYLADAAAHMEFSPDRHKELLLKVIEKENPDLIVFSHSSYGWDLAPRVAYALRASQVSEVVGVEGGAFVVPSCNAKLRRKIRSATEKTVVTLQPGTFAPEEMPSGDPQVEKLSADGEERVQLVKLEAAEATEVDLGKAEIIVSAGRGVGKKENVEIVAQLAKALGGELGASRPVVDAGWVDHSRQVGTTGQTVSPKVYFACGISGAIQHMAGMKRSDFVVAINKDKEAPIREVADVLVVGDVLQFIPALMEKVNRKSA